MLKIKLWFDFSEAYRPTQTAGHKAVFEGGQEQTFPSEEILYSYLAPAFLRPVTARSGYFHCPREDAEADEDMGGYGAVGPVLLHQQIAKSWEKLNAAIGRQKDMEFARAQK